MALEAQENPFPWVTMEEAAADGSETTPNPAADFRKVFLGEDGYLYTKDSAGTVAAASASGGIANPLSTDSLWDAAGDLVQGTGANTAAKLSAGTLGYHLRSGGAAAANVWASRELDYVQITSSVSLTATTEGTAHTCITGTSQAYAAEPIIVEVYVPRIDVQATGSASVVVLLYDGGTVLGRLGVTNTVAAATGIQPHYFSHRLTPTAATHQYIVKAYTSSGTSSFGAGAGGTGASLPAFIRITRAI